MRVPGALARLGWWARVDTGEAGGVSLAAFLWDGDIWEFDASISDGLRGVGPVPDGWGVWVGLGGRLGMGNSAPAAWPKGNAAGGLGPDVEGMVDMLAGRCSGTGYPRIAQGLGSPGQRPEHPVPLQTSGAGMGARGSPRNERPYRRGMNALTGGRPDSGRGWVG